VGEGDGIHAAGGEVAAGGRLALIFHYHRLNTYSFNALAGALDAGASGALGTGGIPIDLALTAQDVCRKADDALAGDARVVVALSLMTCQFGDAARLMRQLQRLKRLRGGDGRLVVLAGGPHATARPGEVLAAGADAVFRGEAEASFPRVLRELSSGGRCAAVQEPDAATDLDRTFSFSPSRGMFGPIEVTRGCAFACRFCQTSQIFGVKLRHRSVGEIVRHAGMLRSINRKVVRLLSPNAFSYGSPDGRELNLGAIRELLEALRGAVGDGRIIFAHFPSEARPEHVTPETLALLREFADNDEIVIGAQSGSERMLERCGRAHTVADVLGAVRLGRRRGYKIIVDFMFGLPGETDEDRRESLKVMEEVSRLGARIHPHIFAPLPQTAFAAEPPGGVSPPFLDLLERFRSRRALYENRPREEA
jgi:B12-binding domain/radical SAM domain protein